VAVKDFSVSKSAGAFEEGEELLESHWHQNEPYNNDCPQYEGDQCVVGCVATAMAQIMNKWQWPPSGRGNYSYIWNLTPSWNGVRCIADPKDNEELEVDLSDGYDWTNMPNECGFFGCSSEEEVALAELNYEVGVTLEMMYGAEAVCGSGVFTYMIKSRVSSALQSLFRYKNTITVEQRKDYTQQSWFDLIKQEVDAGRPMEYLINAHAIVCDGYRHENDELQYHMNYGCNGDDDDHWYFLDELTCVWYPGGICPSEEDFLIAGIEPEYDVTSPSYVSHSVGSTPSTDIDIVFSEALDPATITDGNIIIEGSTSGIPTWTFSTSSDPYVVTLNPDEDFDYSENVSVTVTTGVIDLAGNPLESECIFDFEIGTCPQFIVIPWAGANGSISPSDPFPVCQGDDEEFTATPSSDDYEVDRWFVNGIEEQLGGTKFTVYNIQSSVSVVVWFKAKPEPSGITVLSPNGDEEYAIDGVDMFIGWDTLDGDIGGQVRIELWRNGTFYRLITESVYNDGSTSWGIPCDVLVGGCYKVRISSVAYPSLWDESDDCFEIVREIILPDTLLIYTVEDLQAIGSDGEHPPDYRYVLMDDINATGFPFQPIGTGTDNYFRGVLDGNGHSITWLQFRDTLVSDVGLFSVIDDLGIVRDIRFIDIMMRGDQNVGAIAGRNEGRIINCSVEGVFQASYVRGKETVGGIAGDNTGLIRNCSVKEDGNTLRVRTDNSVVGGIVGANGPGSGPAGVVEFCLANCLIEGEHHRTGGVCGWNGDTIRYCGYEGRQINGTDNFNGGIVGENEGGVIQYSYYSGSNLDGESYIGGIAGYHNGGIIENCLSTGTMSGAAVGGLTGRCDGTIINSFWNLNVTLNATVDGSCNLINSHGETPSELKKQATYTTKYDTNWDFDNVWVITDGLSYPGLRGIGDSLSAPDNVIASSDQSDGVHLSWDDVTFDIGGYTYSSVYRVYRSDSPDANPPETEVTGWQVGHTLVDATAVPEAVYYYWVQAAAGMNGLRSSELGGPAQGQRTYPQADIPTGILASESIPHSILIEWDEANVANFYHVYRSISVGGIKDTLGSWQTGLSYSDIPPYPDTVYYYWVRAAMDDACTSSDNPDKVY